MIRHAELVSASITMTASRPVASFALLICLNCRRPRVAYAPAARFGCNLLAKDE
jgi:hypothetical protein